MKYSKLIAIGLLFCVAQANANVAQFAKAAVKQSPRIYQVAKQYGLKATDLAAKAGKNNFSAATESDVALARRLYYTNTAKGFVKNNGKFLAGAAVTGAGLTGLYTYNKFNQTQEVAQPVVEITPEVVEVQPVIETAPVAEITPVETQPVIEVTPVVEVTPEVVAQEANPGYYQTAKDWTSWAYEGAKNTTVNGSSAALNGAKYYGSQALTAGNHYVVAPVCGYTKAGANTVYNAGLIAKDATVNAAYATANGAKGLAASGYNSAANVCHLGCDKAKNVANGAKYYGSQALTAGNNYVVAPVCGYTKAGANSAYNVCGLGYDKAKNAATHAKYYGSQALTAGNQYVVAPAGKGIAKACELGNSYVVNPSAIALAAAANKAGNAYAWSKDKTAQGYEVSKDFAQKRLAIAATNVQLLKDAAKSGYNKAADYVSQLKPVSATVEVENNSDRIS